MIHHETVVVTSPPGLVGLDLANVLAALLEDLQSLLIEYMGTGAG
jgi:hypothetical protein